jgi:hypothetical protein
MAFAFAHIFSEINPAATTVPLQRLSKPWKMHIVTGYAEGDTIIFLDKHPGQFGFFYLVMNTAGLAEYLSGP